MEPLLIVIPVEGEITVEKLYSPNVATRLREVVQGYIEVVPYFGSYVYKGEKHRCVAFCNEEGKLMDLPVNRRATIAWIDARAFFLDDVLVGDIAVILGDPRFLRKL